MGGFVWRGNIQTCTMTQYTQTRVAGHSDKRMASWLMDEASHEQHNALCAHKDHTHPRHIRRVLQDMQLDFQPELVEIPWFSQIACKRQQVPCHGRRQNSTHGMARKLQSEALTAVSPYTNCDSMNTTRTAASPHHRAVPSVTRTAAKIFRNAACICCPSVNTPFHLGHVAVCVQRPACLAICGTGRTRGRAEKVPVHAQPPQLLAGLHRQHAAWEHVYRTTQA
jgi:hypothetical protein